MKIDLKISQKCEMIGKFHGDFRGQQQKMSKKHSKVLKKQNHCCTVYSVEVNVESDFQLIPSDYTRYCNVNPRLSRR